MTDTEAHAPVQRRRWKRLLVYVTVAVVGLLLGMGGRLVWNAATQEAPVAVPEAKTAAVPETTPPGELVTRLALDPAGTEAAVDDGAMKVSVPPGAVETRQTITISKQRVLEQLTVDPWGSAPPVVYPPNALETYIFTPNTIELNAPITITLRIPPGRDAMAFVTGYGQVRALPGLATGRTVTMSVTNFQVNRPGVVTVREVDK
jgi:hypothetical protein